MSDLLKVGSLVKIDPNWVDPFNRQIHYLRFIQEEPYSDFVLWNIKDVAVVVEDRNGWKRILLPNGDTGWTTNYALMVVNDEIL